MYNLVEWVTTIYSTSESPPPRCVLLNCNERMKSNGVIYVSLSNDISHVTCCFSTYKVIYYMSVTLALELKTYHLVKHNEGFWYLWPSPFLFFSWSLTSWFLQFIGLLLARMSFHNWSECFSLEGFCYWVYFLPLWPSMWISGSYFFRLWFFSSLSCLFIIFGFSDALRVVQCTWLSVIVVFSIMNNSRKNR